jgi:hypothetical protein
MCRPAYPDRRHAEIGERTDQLDARIAFATEHHHTLGRGCLHQLLFKDLIDLAHQLQLLIRLAEIALDAEIKRALAVLVTGPRGNHHDRHFVQA